MRYILAMDQGTTSSRAILFDQHGLPRASAQKEFPQHFPHNGWVEHDPADLWNTQRDVAMQAIKNAGAAAADIVAIGITNQRETTLVWERSTGRPVCPAIVWQDRRTASFCETLKQQGHAPLVQNKTGLVIDAYFSASKLHWILENVPGVRSRAQAGELAFGTVDTWLLFNLTAGRVHATDVSNASRTMLLNIQTQQWDEELLTLFDIPRALLPAVQASSGPFGETEIFGGSIPITGIAGDQQAALFGQTCFEPGMAKCTYGTGCFLLMNSGPSPAASKHQLLSTVGWRVAGESVYALEGSVFIGGAVVQWLRDGLKLIKNAGEIETLARSVPDTGGVYLVPAFAGLGAPHWDPFARGSILGITRSTNAGHFARAALEAIAFQVADIVTVMQQDSGIPICELRVDGGAAMNELLMQFQADLLGVPVTRPKVSETTALGAAYLAGLATGFYASLGELRAHATIEKRFEPTMDQSEAARRMGRWKKALDRSREWEM